MQIRVQLANIKKNDSSMSEYFNKVKKLANTLASIGHHLQDEEVTTYMLAGLGPDYDSLVTSITTRVEPVSLTDLYAHMLGFEMRKEQQSNTLQISDPSGNLIVCNGGCGGKFSSHGGKGRQQSNSFILLLDLLHFAIFCMFQKFLKTLSLYIVLLLITKFFWSFIRPISLSRIRPQ